MAHELLVLTRVAVVVLGAIIAYLSLKGHRRNGGRSMFFVFLGFLLITLGALSAGVLFEFFNVSLVNVYTFDSLMMALGFSSIIFSIYGARG